LGSNAYTSYPVLPLTAGSGYPLSNSLYSTSAEPLVSNNSGSDMAFYNTAGTTRTGYISFTAGGSIKIQGENATGIQFNGVPVSTDGNVQIGSSTPTAGAEKLQVTGAASISSTLLLGGALTLSTTPTTSAGTYDFLTRNTSTGVVEKVASASIGSGLTNVPNSALVQMPANTIKGNNTGSTANAADLTAAQIKTLLGYYTSGSSPTFGTVTATSIVGALTGNSSTATSLQTARTIWGQSFNGSSNISGALSGVTGLTINGGAYSTTLTDVTAGGYTRQIFADGGVNKYLIGYNQTGSDTKFGFFDYASGTWSMTLYGGKVLINSTTPTTGNEQLQINGTASVSNLPNATGDFVTATSTGVLNRRTYAQALSDIGAQAAVTLTTIGTTAAATLIGGTLNIPQYATSNLLTSFYTDVASTTSAADAYSYTLAANSLTTNGQYLDCVYTASQTGGAVNTIIITFGGQTVYNNSANNLLTGTDPIGFKILRSGTTTARCQIYYLTTSGSVAYSTQDLTGVDFTTTNIIKASISSATAGTLTMKSGTITIYK
jgi:fibronectin-binding autotransporter adhesin